MTFKIIITNVAKQVGIPGYGDVLGSRPLGRRAKSYIFNIITSSTDITAVELDFIGVQICDYSFVDEVIIETQIYLKDHTNILLFVANMNETVLGNLQAALALREKSGLKTQILYRTIDTFSYIGSLEENLDLTFKLLTERRSLTARDVANIFHIQINSASNRLKKLYDNRLLLRSELIDITGKQHIYSLPK